MCLIMYKKTGELDYEWFINAQSINADGLGVMYIENDRLKIEKAIDLQEQDLLFQKVNKMAGAKTIHLRFSTGGKTNEENCHPFELLNKDLGDPFDLAVMHNGIIDICSDIDYSDTYYYVEIILKPMLKQNPFLIYASHFKDLVEMSIGNGNKLLFRDSNDNIIVFNEKIGTWKLGTWLSNASYIETNYNRWSGFGKDGWEDYDDTKYGDYGTKGDYTGKDSIYSNMDKIKDEAIILNDLQTLEDDWENGKVSTVEYGNLKADLEADLEAFRKTFIPEQPKDFFREVEDMSAREIEDEMTDIEEQWIMGEITINEYNDRKDELSKQYSSILLNQ